jgi:hypothetical protein
MRVRRSTVTTQARVAVRCRLLFLVATEIRTAGNLHAAVIG